MIKLSRHKPSSNNTRDDSTHGHHHMVNTNIRLTIFFAVEDRKALDHELLISKLPLKIKKVGKPLEHSGMTEIKSITVIQ